MKTKEKVNVSEEGTCPLCGHEIMVDIFDDMEMYFCPTCGKDYSDDYQ